MTKLVAIHAMPADPEAYSRYYFEVHVPLVMKLPGLRRYEITESPIETMSGRPVHLVANMHFDDKAAIQNALDSPQGKAAAADVTRFAANPDDVQIFICEEVLLWSREEGASGAMAG